MREGLRRYDDIIRRIAAEEQVLLIDQSTVVNNTPFYFGDFCHLSEEGTDVFIQQIVDFFLAQHLLPPAN